MNIKEIVTLIEAVSRNGLTSFELEEETIKIKLEKKPEQQIVTMRAPLDVTETVASTITDNTAGVNMITGGNVGIASDKVVSSPLVGTFYCAPAPEAEPFVKVGDKVKKGQILGIIEAMKLMNEIECEYEGTVEAVLIGNEAVVEFGQPLFRIR